MRVVVHVPHQLCRHMQLLPVSLSDLKIRMEFLPSSNQESILQQEQVLQSNPIDEVVVAIVATVALVAA